MNKYIFAISLIVSCKPKENKSSVKSLGFESAQLSCEELHLQFHYDYEHLRYLWSEFQSPESSCNKKLLDIVADGGEDSRDRLPDILEVEQLRQLALEENINNARRQMISISSPSPVHGKGISTVSASAPWRIDRVDLPLSLEEAKGLKCQDLYRGIDSCEQDCSLVRTTIIDLHNFQSLFSKHWEWEDQRDRRSLTAPGMKSLNTDFAFCNTPCLNDPSIACTMLIRL